MSNSKVEIYFFFILFLVVLVVSFFLFLPFLAPLALAVIFAVSFHPVFLWVQRVGGIQSNALAALVTVVALILIVLVPTSFFCYMVFLEARSLFVSMSAGDTDIVGAFHLVEDYIRSYLPGFSINVRGYAQQALGTITASLGSIFAGTAQIAFSIFIFLIAFYYFLKDGTQFRTALLNYSPLQNKYDTKIFERLQSAINSVMKGSLLIALLQGIMTGFGFFIFGVPNPGLWGAAAGVAAFVPTVGTALIIAPAIIFLFVVGNVGAAVGLLIWGVLAVGLIDNFLGPIFVGHGVHIHPLFILLSVLGGVALFGPAGFILGPIVLALLAVLASIYCSFIIVDRGEV